MANDNPDPSVHGFQLSHVEFVPGTELLADGGATNLPHGAKNGIVLVPQPADDIHDPLNWSPWWKIGVLINIAFYMFVGNFTSLSISPMTPVLMKYFDASLTKVALLTGTCILALGYANFIIIPCANVFGRRPTALVCGLICIVANIWEAVATSYNSLLGGRALIGIGSATSESLMPLVIADIVFLHERGKWMGIYFWAFFSGAWLGPVIAGTIAGYVSWRWFFWLTTIMQCVSFVGLVLFFPETKYRREPVLVSQVYTRALPGKQRAETGPTGVAREKQLADPSIREQPSHNEEVAIEPAFSAPACVVGSGRPSKNQRWNIWFKVDRVGLAHLPRDILTPIYISCLPVITFAAICVAGPACALLVLNLLESPALSAPPYNFPPASVGYTNFALMAGGIFGLFFAGPFSDWTSMLLTRRNNGVREPEMRLWSLVPFIVIGLIGMTVAAVGFERLWPWPVIVVIGFGFSGTMVMAIPAIGVTYAIDSYKPLAGEIMVVATVLKNTFAYGMTYYVNDWAIADGYIPPIMTLMALSLGIPAVGIVFFWFWGKSCRRLTRNSKLHAY